MKLFLFLVALSAHALDRVPTKVVTAFAAESGIPLYIAQGLLMSESSNRINVINKTSNGPWQLNTLFHDYYRWKFNDFREFDEYDPISSTRIALRYLAFLHDRFGTWRKALTYYKCGTLPVSDQIKEVVSSILDGRIWG